jgi:hypothetical protein
MYLIKIKFYAHVLWLVWKRSKNNGKECGGLIVIL